MKAYPPEDPRHALVVGGTGMLRRTTLGLAADFPAVSVVARSRAGLAALAGETDGVVRPLPLDYRDGEALRAALAGAAEEAGPVGLVVAWIHRTAPDAPDQIARALAGSGASFSYFHVIGDGDPGSRVRADAVRERLVRMRGLRYRRIILGGVREADRFRWLTNDEIGEGVLAAVRADAEEALVGSPVR